MTKEAWEQTVKDLAHRCSAHPELSKSVPPLDADFFHEVALQFDFSAIREQLNRIHLWILAGNRRENYRPTLLSFLKQAVYVTCPNCNHTFKIRR